MKPVIITKQQAADQVHINTAYANLHEALNELQMVYGKDNTLAHMARQLGAMEDTLFEYVASLDYTKVV